MGWLPENATKTWLFAKLDANSGKLVIKWTDMAETVTTKEGTFEIRSEAHGPHWVAWLARTADGGAGAGGAARRPDTGRSRSTRAPMGGAPLVLLRDPRTQFRGDRDGTAVARPITCSIKPQYVPFASSETTDNPGSSVR